VLQAVQASLAREHPHVALQGAPRVASFPRGTGLMYNAPLSLPGDATILTWVKGPILTPAGSFTSLSRGPASTKKNGWSRARVCAPVSTTAHRPASTRTGKKSFGIRHLAVVKATNGKGRAAWGYETDEVGRAGPPGAGPR
jgi:hypothetical protein